MKFEFTRDTIRYTLELNMDKSASGTIGRAIFQNGRIRKNGGNPKITGIAYIVECGEIDKIFAYDPFPGKEVEIWLSPIAGSSMKGELRFTSGSAHFPMGGMVFKKME